MLRYNSLFHPVEAVSWFEGLNLISNSAFEPFNLYENCAFSVAFKWRCLRVVETMRLITVHGAMEACAGCIGVLAFSSCKTEKQSLLRDKVSQMVIKHTRARLEFPRKLLNRDCGGRPNE